MGPKLCSVEGNIGSCVIFSDTLKDFLDPLRQLPHVIFFCWLTPFDMYMFTGRTLMY